MLGNYQLLSPIVPRVQRRAHVHREPEPREIIETRSDILRILLDIDRFASQNPERRVSIRNRTRESITRLLHYERDSEKLTRMKTDAQKLLSLWQGAN